MINICGFENIDLVVFDKDGTLIDLHSFWGEVIRRRAVAIAECFDLSNVPHSVEKISDMMGLDIQTGRLKPSGPVGIVGRAEVISVVVSGLSAEFDIHTDETKLAHLFDIVHKKFSPVMSRYIHLLPNVKTFLKKICGHAKIALITSDDRASAITALTHTEIIDFFDIIIARQDYTKPKQTGQPLADLLKRLNILPQRVLVVGDAMMDYLMAKNVGVPNILLVATGQSSVDELKRGVERASKTN